MKDNAPAVGRHRMLAEGQELLLARRSALHLAREGNSASQFFSDPDQSPHPETANSEQFAAIVSALPEHLGWGSAAQTAVFRAAAKRHDKNQQKNEEHTPLWAVDPDRKSEKDLDEDRPFSAQGAVSLAPSLGLAILRHKQAPAARLWLLLRALDNKGRGAVSLDSARKAFSGQESALRFCGPRQLRNLLVRGAGIFWQINNERIWLRSTARVAQTLGVPHFRGGDVAIPISTLTIGIGAVRANLFAAFHSGRGAKPISRQTMARKSSVAPRTQRHYDRLSGVKKQANYARGPIAGSKEAEEQAWQQGSASFTWRVPGKDHKERNGRYLAWQLPNSYHGPHARLGHGRQKRQNKALADLLNKGTAGNDHSQKDDLNPRYFADARAASRAFGRNETAVYWPDLKPGLWHCLWPQNKPGKTNHGQKEA